MSWSSPSFNSNQARVPKPIRSTSTLLSNKRPSLTTPTKHNSLVFHRFAGSLLKRTLSESCAGGGTGAVQGADEAELYPREPRDRPSPKRMALAARSLSLELARHRHRLAAQLVCIGICYGTSLSISV